MAFNFGTPKSASGFTLPTTTTQVTAPAASVQFNFGSNTPSGGGDLNAQNVAQAKPLFGSTSFGAAAVPSTGASFNFNTGSALAAATTAPATFNLGATAATVAPTFNMGMTAASIAPATNFSFGAAATTPTVSTGFPLGSLKPASTTATSSLSFGSLVGTNTTTTASFLGGLGTTSALTTVTSTTLSGVPATGTLTFGQLEDLINKWTVDLEEQGKVYGNQARHLNAWDRLLISNGEKILSVSNGVERVKQQQQQLDQELDFILSQQKELEDCIAPLEKELEGVSVSDVDRDQTYKLAENIDVQLKQMSEDLKEIIEHLNESNKSQESSDPVAQIGRILDAHMNSLQWIDRNTSEISSHLDEIAKMQAQSKFSYEKTHGS